MMSNSYLVLAAFFVAVCSIVHSTAASNSNHARDEYLTEAETQCYSREDLFSCGKYRVLRYISTVEESSIMETNVTKSPSTLPIRMVRIAVPDESLALFPQAARSFLPGTSEISQFLGFVQRRIDRYLRKQGIAIPLPRGVFINDEDTSVGEARKKKKDIIIPLLILFTVFKVKVLVGLALVGIFFIKKVILLSALILPSILHNLKMSCKQAHVTVPHGHSHVEDYHDDSIAGYYSNAGSYGKDWDRRYRAAKAGSVQMQ